MRLLRTGFVLSDLTMRGNTVFPCVLLRLILGARGLCLQRKRDGGKVAPVAALPKEEQEALARREAARQRVQQRTKAGFGLI